MSGQSNRSSAVMQQRHAGRDEYDYYPTPPWGTRALCDYLERKLYQEPGCLKQMSVWEPACGEGYMARPLSEYFGRTLASDIQDFRASYPDQADIVDFLLDWGLPAHADTHDWIITNPPFVQGQAFVEKALGLARMGVAMIVRNGFLESIDRYNELYRSHPPDAVLQFVERIPMEKGRCRKDASSATSYVWLIWAQTTDGPHTGPALLDWLPPGTRQAFEHADDYPDWGREIAPAPLFDGAGL